LYKEELFRYKERSLETLTRRVDHYMVFNLMKRDKGRPEETSLGIYIKWDLRLNNISENLVFNSMTSYDPYS